MSMSNFAFLCLVVIVIHFILNVQDEILGTLGDGEILLFEHLHLISSQVLEKESKIHKAFMIVLHQCEYCRGGRIELEMLRMIYIELKKAITSRACL